MENEIVISEDEIEDITSTLSNSYVNVSSTGGSVNQEFSGAVRAGLLGDSIGTIGRQMDSISHSISNVNNLIQQHSEQMINYDSVMSNKIDEIIIPNDFLINNSSKVNTYTKVLLNKIDGKSVNEGQSAQKFNDIDESVIKEKQLSDISGNETVKQSYDASSSIGAQEALASITKESDLNEKVYDSASSVDSINLADMSGKDSTDSVNYDGSSMIKSSTVLTNMDNSSANGSVNYDGNTIVKEQSLSDMNNNHNIVQNSDYSSSVLDEGYKHLNSEISLYSNKEDENNY